MDKAPDDKTRRTVLVAGSVVFALIIVASLAFALASSFSTPPPVTTAGTATVSAGRPCVVVEDAQTVIVSGQSTITTVTPYATITTVQSISPIVVVYPAVFESVSDGQTSYMTTTITTTSSTLVC